ncbi:thioredoxin domain-containing protein [Candidatus Woesearchaeota archaeon]|nr:thioredoxin domain-containing protein [Candidatus Woesearchaeota archaeon]
MICLIALIAFGILGIFSVSYRKLALEAFDCVFRRITLRKCESGLDQRLKSQITGKLMVKSPKLASKIYKNFEVISWIFTILMIASTIYSGYGIYNFLVHGNCNGPDSNALCIFDPLKKEEPETCSVAFQKTAELEAPEIGDSPSLGSLNSKITIIEFGCYTCQYTREAQETVEKVLKEYKGTMRFVYKSFPLPNHESSKNVAIAAECAKLSGKFWLYNSLLFNKDIKTDDKSLISYAKEANINITQFEQCLNSQEAIENVDIEFNQGIASGIYGTPTFFINNISLVGPQSFEEFTKIIKKELRK